MIILVTGAFHTGKTILAQRILEKYIISDLRRMLNDFLCCKTWAN